MSLILSAALLLLSGCGKDSQTAAAAAGTTSAASEVRLVKIVADDAMKFSLSEIRAKAGETLAVSLTNAGRMPKQVMAHNWVLLRPMTDAEINAFAMNAATKAPVYLPDDQSAVLAHTRLLGAGETHRIEITAPTTPGSYPFICTFPGHFVMMKGKLIVE